MGCVARSPTRLLRGLLVVGLLGASVWLVLRAFGPGEPRPPAAPLVGASATPAASSDAQLLGAEGPELRGLPGAPRPGASEPAAEAAPANTLEVTVLDADGRVVEGVGVSVGLRHDGQLRHARWTSRTDAQGRAWLRLDPASVAGLRAQHPGMSFAVEADIAHPERPWSGLGPDPLAHGPVTLRLPRAPRLEVEVVDETGALIQERTHVYAFWRRPGEGPAGQLLGQASVEMRGGRGTFPVIPPGFEILLRAMGTATRHWAEAVVLPQPADAGTVRARIALDVQKERLRVRLVDPEQRPLAGAQVTVAVWLAPWDADTSVEPFRPPGNAVWRDADAQGVLTFAVPTPPQPRRKRVLYVARAATNPRTDEIVPRLFALLPLEGRLRPGTEIDLGDLALQAEVLREILAGRVVDEEGQPLAGVSVYAEFEHVQEGTQHRQGVCAPLETGADGAFLLRGAHVPPGRIELRATGKGFHAAALETVSGTRDIQLRLKRR